MVLANARVIIANEIHQKILKNPQLNESFICCVAETVSIPELYAIRAMFLEAERKAPAQCQNLNN